MTKSEFRLYPSREHGVDLYLTCEIIDGECKKDAKGNLDIQMNICSKSDYLRLLKGIYTNKERFNSRFLSVKRKNLQEHVKNMDTYYGEIVNRDLILQITNDFLDFLETNYDDAVAFNYREAFLLTDQSFRAAVFSSINVSEMMKNLDSKKIKVDGIGVTHKKYDKKGTFLGTEDYHNIYETYELSGAKLGLNESLYAVKCWCTSTNKEHWLWITDEHKDDPLSAIASTFKIHKNLIPYIKELKRQGDILITELTEKVEPEGEIVSLTKEQYFSLLTAQS